MGPLKDPADYLIYTPSLKKKYIWKVFFLYDMQTVVQVQVLFVIYNQSEMCDRYLHKE